MTFNRLFLWALALLLALTTACSDSDIPQTGLPQEPAKPHTYRLSLDMPVPSFDGKTTRGTTEWEDGSKVEFKFYTYKLDVSGGDPSTTPFTFDGYWYTSVNGIATYDATNDIWNLQTEEQIPSNRNMTDCEVWYKPQTGSDNQILTAVFYGTTSYTLNDNTSDTLNDNQVLCGSITLKPTNWRLHFQGAEGLQFNLTSEDIDYVSGGPLHRNFADLENNVFDTITLTVAADGHTPYIYGTFKNETGDNTITIETGGHKYTRIISGTALKPGETGYIVIPTESNYEAEGWKKEETSEEIKAVDLGLPSGLLWANMNVGASKSGDYGDCFAWG